MYGDERAGMELAGSNQAGSLARGLNLRTQFL